MKENNITKGLRTTGASQFIKNFNDPLYDATAVEKLNREKSITIGKVNMDEFAMGSTSENSSFQTTRNPWNLDHVPGGSSGGSAAAVARSEEHTSELQSRGHLVCRLLLEKKTKRR